MGIVPTALAADLRFALDLRRAIETGTYKGHGVSALAPIFPEVVSIELSEQLYERAAGAFAGNPRIRIVQGESAQEVRELVDPATPTFFFLDAHWSGGTTAGADTQCPVLLELDAMRGGHPDDCVVIDDARLFREPPPPLDPAQWPSLDDVVARLVSLYPGHRVAVIDDQIVGVPARVWWIAELWRTTALTGRRPLRAQMLRLSPRRVRRRVASTVRQLARREQPRSA